MRVVHVREKQHTHYIGRPSVLGNPFPIGAERTRTDVILQFEEYARRNPEVLDAIRALPHDAVLGCWCKPRSCHGDVIVRLWNEMNEPDLWAV